MEILSRIINFDKSPVAAKGFEAIRPRKKPLFVEIMK